MAEIRLGKMLQSSPTSPNDLELAYLRAGSLESLNRSVVDPPRMWASPADLMSYGISPGDLVVAEGGDVGRAEFVPELGEPFIIQNSLHRVRCLKGDVRFIRYVLQHIKASGWLDVICNRSTFGHLTVEKLASLRVSWPARTEQTAIADFLDADTRRIDALVTKKRHLIELLDERHRVLVADSMAGYPLTPLKRVVTYTEGPGIMADDFRDEGVPLIRVAGVGGPVVTLDGCNYLDPVKVRRQWSHFALSPGDRVISASATMGTVSVVGADAAGAIPYTGLIRFRPRSGQVSMDYVEHFLGSSLFVEQINLLKTGTAIQHYGPTHLGEVSIPLPPLDMQSQIAETLGESRRALWLVGRKVGIQIDRLTELRQAAVSAAVTGELDIAGAAA